MPSLTKRETRRLQLGRLLLKNAVPLIISMLVQALYNMVDSLYVSQVSQAAFNAVSLSYPIQNIMIAIATGTGTGLVALISKSLGEKDTEKANQLAVHGIFLAVCSYFVILIFGFVGVDAFFRSQTDIPEILEGGKAYLSICCIFSFGIFGQIVMERLMQSVGRSNLSMWTLMVGAITNIILDPILIFGWGPFPVMGVAGAAVATVVGQIFSMITGIILNHHFNTELKLRFRGFRPDGKMILSIYKIGIPSMLTMGVGSVMTFMMNKLLIAIEATATAAAVFGAYFKLQSFFNMPVLGLSQGMSPIVGFNLGAKNKHRMLETYRLSVRVALLIMCLAAAAFLLIPDVLLKLFNASPFMLEIGEPAFRIIAVSFIFSAYGIVTSQFFMACGKSLLALLMAVARQLVILVPAAYALGYAFGYTQVWWAVPIGELGAMAMAVYGRVRMQKRLFDHMPDVPPTIQETATETVIKESKPGVIITIAREHGSQGKQTGRLVAEKLGIPFYYKEMTALAAQEIGFDKEFVSDINRNSPTLMRDLYLSTAPVSDAIIAQAKIIRRIADNGSCVIVGRAADHVLRGHPNVVTVFLHAPEEYRIKKVMEMCGDTAEDAAKHIKRADTARAAYYKSISGKTWGEAENYDISLSCENGIEQAVETIVNFIKNR